ncbi:tyrosine-type recombinase/integrase [Cesiribacter sp. SM1]|uniref:tyrosine-type recombinase/integrase n=1 Tax=Cesiribacter sp. SM1 TaxID=2861196 RepID=UPI001CD618BB|nr:tyrosine-type recombinase/integrase [Cesiribacter sp. SM1]
MKNLPLQNHYYKELEQQFSRWLQLLGYSKQSCYNLPLHVREFLNYLEEKALPQIKLVSPQELEDYLHYLQQERCHQRNGSALSPAHLNKHVQALNLLSRYLTEIGAEAVSWRLPMFRASEPLPKVLSQHQVQQLYAACSATSIGLRDRALLSILYGCGLRRSEAAALRVEDARLQARQLYVRKAKGNKQRYVPLSPGVAEDLQQYLELSRPLLLKAPTNALLLTYAGKALGGQGMMRRLELLLEIAKIPAEGIGLHTLRHSIATHLLQAGMKLENISRFLGHSSLESTQIYTHIINEL